MCRKTASIALVCVGALALLALLWVLPAALLYCSAQVALLGSGGPAWLAVVLSPASVVLAPLRSCPLSCALRASSSCRRWLQDWSATSPLAGDGCVLPAHLASKTVSRVGHPT